MSVASVTGRGRSAAEANMSDTCIIFRPDPDAEVGVMDEDTMQYPEVETITVYSGPCRVQIKSIIASASDSNAGERQGTTQELELQLPVAGTDEVAVTDVARILTSVLDGSLVDREFTIAARHEKSHATSRRLRVIETTA